MHRTARSGALSHTFIQPASSHRRQSPVVGPDGDPRPPESVLTRHGRRRRIPFRLQERLRKTSPCERDVHTISEVGVPGDNASPIYLMGRYFFF